MQVVVKNNSVVFGPVDWDLTKVAEDFGGTILPAIIGPTPSYDAITQDIAGPSWIIGSDNATSSYTVVNKSLDEIKNSLIRKVSLNKKDKMAKIISVPVMINNINYYFYVSDAQLLSQKIAIEKPFAFKTVNNDFVTLSISDAQSVLISIDTAIQSLFDWEFTVVSNIQAATDVQSALSISLE